MNSNLSSRILVGIAALVLIAGVASGVTITGEDAPGETRAEAKITATFTFEELFRSPSLEQWTLDGSTDLSNVTWTVTGTDQAGNRIGQSSYDGATFRHGINISSDVADVRVRVTGTAPRIENYTYDPPERFVVAEFRQVREGGTSSVVETYRAHHYTQESREARRAIDSAGAAIQQAGGHQQARTTLDNAISAYEAGNFDNAVDLANQARQTVTRAQRGQQRMQLVIYAVVGLVIIGLAVGGFLWYRSKQRGSRL